MADWYSQTRRLLACGTAIWLGSSGAIAAEQAIPPSSNAAQSETAAVPPASADLANTASEASGGAVGDIVVTARRREESLQKVPVAVTALTQELLQKKQIVTTSDLATSTPSLTVQPALAGRQSANFFIRGQGATYGGALPSVITYFSEVPLDASGGGSFALNDLQSVQILRGPQGTLFGRNANGGAVVLTPRAPGDKFEGNFDLTGGNYAYVDVKGGVSIPITETLGVRVSGEYVRHDGFTKNISGRDFDNLDQKSWRVFVRWRPTDWFSNDLIYNGLSGSDNGIGSILAVVRPGSVATRYPIPGLPNQTGTGLLNDLAAQQLLGRRTVNDPEPSLGDTRNIQLVANTSTFSFGGVTIKNIAGYERTKVCTSVDIQDVPTNFQLTTCMPNVYGNSLGIKYHPNVDLRQLSDELQVSGDGLNSKLQWLVGGFILDSATPGGLNKFDPSQTSKSTVVVNVATSNTHDKSQAVYGQATYSLTDTLKLTGGLRYTWDQRALTFGQLVSRANGAAGSFACATPGHIGAPTAQCFNTYESKTSDYGYTASVDWQAAPNLLLYAVTRRGYKAGGVNNLTLSATPFYNKEILTDVEAGAKLRINSGFARGSFNVDYYHDWYKGTQLQETLLINGVASVQIANAKGANIDGVEAELNLQLFERLNVSGFYSYVNARYNNGAFIDGGVDASASPFLGVSKNTFSATVGYEMPMGDNIGTIEPSVTYFTRSKAAFAANTVANPEGFGPGYQTVSAQLEWSRIGGSRLTATAFVKNLTNRDYIVGGFALGAALGNTSYFYGDPRTYGLSLRYSF